MEVLLWFIECALLTAFATSAHYSTYKEVYGESTEVCIHALRNGCMLRERSAELFIGAA